MNQTTISGMSDELLKIAEYHVRIGRKPISVDRLLEREVESPVTPSEAFQSKVSAVDPSALKALGILTLGGVGALGLRQMNEDRKVGRQVRTQGGY